MRRVWRFVVRAYEVAPMAASMLTDVIVILVTVGILALCGFSRLALGWSLFALLIGALVDLGLVAIGLRLRR